MSLQTITIKLNLYKIKELTKKQQLKEKQLKIFDFVVKIKTKMNPNEMILAQIVMNLILYNLFLKKIPSKEAEDNNLSH